MARRDASIANDIVVGALAGLLASYAMNAFQEAVSSVDSGGDQGDRGDPSTVRAAQLIAGRELPKGRKEAAGSQVHYTFGAILGALYGGIAAMFPAVTFGFGVPYGIAVAAIADEALVPALGLSSPPWKSSAGTHAYSLSSHMVFGLVLEGARRVLRARME